MREKEKQYIYLRQFLFSFFCLLLKNYVENNQGAVILASRITRPEGYLLCCSLY